MRNDAIEEVENNIPSVNPVLNNRFVQSPIYTISSISDADNFCNMYNHDNNYGSLQLGQTITINDGTYNKDWYVAGFDCEYNHKAADGTTKNSGYGICLIPTKNLTDSVWHSVNSVAYMNSTIHTLCNGTIANNLKKVLGDHLVNRNVLLGSSANTSQTTGYTWTKSYVTLMSQYQLMGGSLLDDENENIYDRGEANYKLPLFKYFPFEIPVLSEGYYSDYYLRTLLAVDSLQRPRALNTASGHSISGYPCLYSSGVRPMIYIH